MVETTALVLRPGGASELLRVIRVNEDIKKVVHISRVVSLTALNAKFMSHKSGARSLGFGVVSTELRNFSRDLGLHMAAMERLIYSLVGRVAYVQRRRRQIALLRRAFRGNTGAVMMESLQRQLDGVGQEISQEQARFRHELDRALKLCKLGSTFAQRAKVEAVYGNELAGGLTQVSNQVEEAVFNTINILKSIQGHVEG